MARAAKKEISETTPSYGNHSPRSLSLTSKIKGSVDNEVSSLRAEQKKLLQQFKKDNKERLNELREIKKEFAAYKKETSAWLEKLSVFSKTSTTEMREKLIKGIKLLGGRVATAVKDMNEKIDNFADEVEEKLAASKQENNQLADEPFGALKEGELLSAETLELVPKKSIETLVQLFQHQTTAMKTFINKQEQRMLEMEFKLRSYDEENTRLLELLNNRVERNFRIFLYAIALLVLLIFLILLFK